MSAQSKSGKTIRDLTSMRARGEKIACLTAYDASFAKALDQAGIDVILVGDSLGMVIQGRDNTVSVTMQDMIYHCRCVSSVTENALVIADMPFMSYTSTKSALRNATALMQQGGAQMVKLEATERQVDIVSELSECGIPVCAHLGLRPQFIHKLGGYSVQGKTPESAQPLLNAAKALQQAGADLVLVECIDSDLAAQITRSLSIPVIGIGAGPQCDGQVLVLQDVLGITPGTTPSFARNYMDRGSIQDALKHYIRDVKAGDFP
jgi:3-methyl-2-oxobutanoate hydroxymethyltransferase